LNENSYLQKKKKKKKSHMGNSCTRQARVLDLQKQRKRGCERDWPKRAEGGGDQSLGLSKKCKSGPNICCVYFYFGLNIF
jgi:hypothetical protein